MFNFFIFEDDLDVFATTFSNVELFSSTCKMSLGLSAQSAQLLLSQVHLLSRLLRPNAKIYDFDATIVNFHTIFTILALIFL